MLALGSLVSSVQSNMRSSPLITYICFCEVMVEVVKDSSEKNIRVCSSLVLMGDGVFPNHYLLFRMRCQTAGVSWGISNQAARVSQIRELRLVSWLDLSWY